MPSRSETDPALRALTRENARWLALLLSPSHDPEAQAKARQWADDWFDALPLAAAAAEAAPLDVEPDWDRIHRAWSMVFSFVPDKDERAEIERQYAALRSPDTETAGEAG